MTHLRRTTLGSTRVMATTRPSAARLADVMCEQEETKKKTNIQQTRACCYTVCKVTLNKTHNNTNDGGFFVTITHTYVHLRTSKLSRTFSRSASWVERGLLVPTPTCLASSRSRHTMTLGSEHSPLLVGDEPEESPSRTSMRRALRFAGASPRFPNNTHVSDRRGFLTDALASPVASAGDVRPSVSGSRAI